jgi:LmbE family N-acetylglucosaminyl deacetylase
MQRINRSSRSFLEKAVARITWGLALCALMALSSPAFTASAKSTTCPQTTMSVVAHPDDDLLFINPDLMNDYDVGRCLVTVYVTAGDAGIPLSDYYVQSREDGIREAYATMAGLPDSWTEKSVPLGTRTLRSFTLNDTRTPLGVRVIFMRLPDGAETPAYDYQSLLKLLRGQISTITAVDDTARYSERDLIATLTELIDMYHPSTVRTADVASVRSDHPDHETVARYTRNAALAATPNPELVSYRGYKVSGQPRNLSFVDHARKHDIMAHYARHEGCRPAACPPPPTYMPSYEHWVGRKYERTRGPAGAGTFLSWVGSTDVDGTTWNNTDRCLDVQVVPGGVGAVRTYACNGTTAQQWHWDGTTVRTALDNHCLTATDTGNPRAEECTGAANQDWAFTSLGQLSSGGRCLQQDDWLENDPKLSLAACTPHAEQRWDQNGTRTPH